MIRTKKPTKPVADYTADEIRETAVYRNLVATLSTIPDHEAVRLTRAELASQWDDVVRGRVNKACDAFRKRLAALGVTGKTIKLTLVHDTHGNYFYDVHTCKGGRKLGSDETLPVGSLSGLRSYSLRD